MWSRKSGIACIRLLLMLTVVLIASWAVTLPATAQDVPVPTDAATAHAGAEPETCSVCHKEAGDKHQASYDELYQDGVIQVTDLAYAFAGPDTTTVTFKMTKDGVPFDALSLIHI